MGNQWCGAAHRTRTGQPQDGGRQGQTRAEAEGHGGEALAQPLPQEHVRPDRGGEEPPPRLNPNSKCGGMATHAGLAIELGITRKKSLSPQMEAILIWCQCRTREYDNVNICDFTQSWSNGLAFCALIHNFFPNAFDYNALKVDSPRDRLKNYEVAFVTGEKFAGVPDFLTAEDMSAMVEENRIDPKMIFSHSSFQGAKSRLLSAGCFLGKPYMRFDRSIR